MSESNISNKIWSMAGVLMDDGISNGDYLEQLTYLIFLKMADEYSKPPYSKNLNIPTEYAWSELVNKSGAELANQYKNTLEELGKSTGILQEIYTEAQNKISKPAVLTRLINMINSENWVSMAEDVKGEIYESLLSRVAEDTKSGAGQYFTPRPLINAIVECVAPAPMKTIVDPCCGSGGFLLSAKSFIETKYNLNKNEKIFLRDKTFKGWELVRNTYRLCLMNLFLHNIGSLTGNVPITRNDSLLYDPDERFDYILTNPPFGKKSSYTIENEEGEEEKESLTYNRQDFWATSSNKQLNFVQHINTLLKVGGTAAVVVPDNVLFEGGAGEIVRKKLLETTNLHTILRLPTGIFYKQGVKANVIFFKKEEAGADIKTKEIWIYDFRTNINFTLKKNPLKLEHLNDFIECYNAENIHQRKETYNKSSPDSTDGRWRKFTYEEITKRDKTNLDITWIKDKALADLDNLPEPEELAIDIMQNLQRALEDFNEITQKLK